MESLGIFAKFPQAGKVKSRLGKTIGYQESAELYHCFLQDIITRLNNIADKRTLCYSPGTNDSTTWFRELAQDDYHLWLQPEVDLGSRMISFVQAEFDQQASKVVIIGTDSPSLPLQFIEDAFVKLSKSDVVIGPATDGGFYLIGFSNPEVPDLSAVNWSSSTVLEETVEIISQNGLSLDLLSPWYDIDSVEDLQLLSGHLKAFSKIFNHPEMNFTEAKLKSLLPEIKKLIKPNK